MKISLPSKVSLFVFSLFSLLLASFTYLSVNVSAQVPKPRVPCDKTSDPEFDYLRPYQASPCGGYTDSFFCGNKINIVESKTARRKGEWDSIPVDWWNGGTPDGKDYWIDLSETKLPILGNTELVKNSQSGTDQIDDATKLNEYVSWYLNGVNNKAEYGSEKNTADEVINFSGPIQKLLPSIIQDAQRVASIASASATVTVTPDEDEPTVTTTEPYTHNQIVVCASPQLGIIGKMVPHDCYEGDGSPAKGKVYRLKDWDSHLPPLPWDSKYKGDEKKYLEDRCTWEGGKSITIPIINKTVCIDNPLNSNEWADLFQYVPLATTPDKLGKMPINVITVQPSGADMDFQDKSKLAAPSLYYSHTQEVKDLSETLNKTYLPQGATVSEISYETTEKNDNSTPPKCRVLDVRTNPGDDLFPIRSPGDIGVNVKFHVNALTNCHTEEEVNEKTGKVEIFTVCTGEVHIGIHTDPNKMPYIDDIWKTTVAGTGSTFRKIFPKVEVGAPVSCIADIPGVTKAVYKPVQGTDSIGVEGPLGSVDQEAMDPENAKIYFSHLGGIYEYFLKGIQTALRPQGYGEKIPNGELCKSSEEAGDCSFNMNKINQAIQKAAAKYKVSEELLRAIFEIESYEYIADPSSYKCEENFAGAAGVAQITKSTYDSVTCGSEKMDNDIPMCGSYRPQLSRCSIDDAFELMARILLLKAGRWNPANCTPTGGISESEIQVWYSAACNYYGSFAPDALTIGLANDIPPDQRRQNGDMNYCDIVGYKMGKFPPYP